MNQELPQEPRDNPVSDVTSGSAVAAELLGALGDRPRESERLRECALPSWAVPPPDGALCDGRAHWEVSAGCVRSVGPCPHAVRSKARSRVDAERERLEPLIAQIARYNPKHEVTWESVEGTGPALEKAKTAAMRFSALRPPKSNLVLIGKTGLCKTHLLLCSHFALLEAGIDSEFRTHEELKTLFRRDAAREDGERDHMPADLARLYRCQVLHIDDLGPIENDQRPRGLSAAGLKALLDGTSAVIFATTNCSSADFSTHPDLSDKIASRLFAGAYYVRLDGQDFRLRTTRGFRSDERVR